MNIKIASGFIAFIGAAILLEHYAPDTLFYKPSEETLTSSELKDNDPDIRKRANAVNEMGILTARLEGHERVVSDREKDRSNSGLEAVNYLVNTTKGALEQKQKNGMTGFEILVSPPASLAKNFSTALSGNKDLNNQLATDFTKNLEGALSKADKTGLPKDISNQYDNLDR